MAVRWKLYVGGRSAVGVSGRKVAAANEQKECEEAAEQNAVLLGLRECLMRFAEETALMNG